jgi:hypothetical protein
MDAELLPSGLYFRPGTYLEQSCPACPRPRYAGLIGLYGNVKAAQRALNGVPQNLLPPGYPWAVLAEDLMLKDRRASGIALVAGLVADKASAARLSKAWRRRTGRWLRIVELADSREAERRTRRALARDAGGDKRPVLVQTDPGPAVEAFDEVAFEDRPLADGPKPTPVCKVPPRSLFLFPSKRHLYRFGRVRSPARCGERIVYVPWTRTLNESVVLRRPDGRYRLVQVTDVSCDRPRLDAWTYGREGRLAKLPSTPPPPGEGPPARAGQVRPGQQTKPAKGGTPRPRTGTSPPC